mmetsp:Transcript_105946/g.252784  ORF Transcript_105946/g.252784 Transcript_105946/m.252784 type:complete len:247 (+) Transcript_105946:151-891(+)
MVCRPPLRCRVPLHAGLCLLRERHRLLPHGHVLPGRPSCQRPVLWGVVYRCRGDNVPSRCLCVQAYVEVFRREPHHRHRRCLPNIGLRWNGFGSHSVLVRSLCGLPSFRRQPHLADHVVAPDHDLLEEHLRQGSGLPAGLSSNRTHLRAHDLWLFVRSFRQAHHILDQRRHQRFGRADDHLRATAERRAHLRGGGRQRFLHGASDLRPALPRRQRAPPDLAAAVVRQGVRTRIRGPGHQHADCPRG